MITDAWGRSAGWGGEEGCGRGGSLRQRVVNPHGGAATTTTWRARKAAAAAQQSKVLAVDYIAPLSCCRHARAPLVGWAGGVVGRV